jgi:tripartite-type tricarboxylate transporter receptor subunit TctC
VERLNVAVNKVLKTDVVLAAFEKFGAFPGGGSSSDFRQYYEDEVNRWSGVIRKGDIKIAP